MALHIDAIGRAVLVVHTADEGLHGLDVSLPHARQLAQLQYPVPLQLLRTGFVLHVRQRQAVREPFPGELRIKGGLPDALRAIQDWYAVKLRTRTVYPCNRRCH